MSDLAKQAFIASLCAYPDAQAYITRAYRDASPETVTTEMAAVARTMTKADFFSLPMNGKEPALDSVPGWSALPKIAWWLALNDERFEVSDFMAKMPSGKTFLKSAETHGGLGNIFQADVWRGRHDEMENLWFFVSASERRKFNGGEGILPVRREILAKEKKAPREDVLLRAGIAPGDMGNALMEDGRLEAFDQKLQAVGERFSKADVFVLDAMGETMFASRTAWARYDKVVDLMARNGERFEVEDFLFRRGTRLDILSRAAEAEAMDKVFNPRHWVGRVDDMISLWSHTKPAWHVFLRNKNFAECVADAEDLTWGARLQNDKSWVDGGRAALVTPLKDDKGALSPVVPLGLKSVWADIEGIMTALDRRGEQLTLQDMRATSGHYGSTIMLTAAQAGRFDKVLEIAEKTGGKLTADDFLTSGRDGKTLLQTLADRKQLKLVFSDKMWAGRMKEMQSLWHHIPLAQRSDIDFIEVQSRVRIASLDLYIGQPRRQNRGGAAGPKP